MRARDLGALQHWMQDAIWRGAGLPEDVEQLVEPSSALSARERLGIYADMIRLRLVECLENDFPGLRHALGAEDCDALCRAYCQAQPSTHYSLNAFGAGLPAFIREHFQPRAARGFLGDLAELERAVQDAFDAPQSSLLSPEQLAGVPPEAWGDLKLPTSACLQLCAFSYPVHDYLRAVLEERGPSRPRPRDQWVAVYRREFRVWRAELAREQYLLLEALRAGLSLGEALQSCAATPQVDAQLLTGSLSDWFAEWTREGLFVSLARN